MRSNLFFLQGGPNKVASMYCIYPLPFYSRTIVANLSLTKCRLKPSSIYILPSHPYQKHQSISGYFILESLYLRQNDDAER